MGKVAALSAERKLQSDIASFYDDPLGFVMYAYPWGEQGVLEDETGPDTWQREHLESVGESVRKNPLGRVREATSTGHGTGKTTTVAWLIHWLMSTRFEFNGVVTANTRDQLRTKTWRELALWHKRSIHEHWFTWTGTRFYHTDHEKTWATAALTNNEENSEAFAGLHGKHVAVWFDEASAIPAKIWEVTEGALTTERTFWFVYGNPTLNTGRFKSCFTSDADRWNTRKVDVRQSKLVDQGLVQEWANAYGEDSDFFRVRAMGEFPHASTMQFIREDKVQQAIGRQLPYEAYAFMPLIMGIDVARGGDEATGGGDYGGDDNVIALRRGRKLEQLIEFPGRGDVIQVAMRLRKEIDLHKPAVVFCDVVGNAAGVVDMLRQWGYEITGVNAHVLPDDEEEYQDKRIEMWDRMRVWLNDADILDNKELAEELCEAQFGHARMQKRGELLALEKKKHIKARLGRSTDRADALAHTFYYKLAGGNHAKHHVGDEFGGIGSLEPSEEWI